MNNVTPINMTFQSPIFKYGVTWSDFNFRKITPVTFWRMGQIGARPEALRMFEAYQNNLGKDNDNLD